MRVALTLPLPLFPTHCLLERTLTLFFSAALPVFLGALVPGWLAIVLSVTLVLFVGEIIPAAIMTGPKQLQIAAKLTPMVYVVISIFFLIAYPISFLLDTLIGHDEGVKVYNRQELTTMVSIQHEEGMRQEDEERQQHQQHEGNPNPINQSYSTQST